MHLHECTFFIYRPNPRDETEDVIIASTLSSTSDVEECWEEYKSSLNIGTVPDLLGCEKYFEKKGRSSEFFIIKPHDSIYLVGEGEVKK